jgi:hypothetical protein
VVDGEADAEYDAELEAEYDAELDAEYDAEAVADDEGVGASGEIEIDLDAE